MAEKTKPRRDRLCLVLTTVPNLKSARQLAALLLERRAAACVSVSGPVASSYWWEGKIARDTERMLWIKTRRGKLSEAKKLLKATHPYTTPEIVVLEASEVDDRYFKWMLSVTSSSMAAKKSRRVGS